MKHLRRMNENDESEENTLSILDAKVFTPSDDDLEKLAGLIMDTFPGSEVGITEDRMVVVTQGNDEVAGSATDWIMALTDLHFPNGGGGESVMKLFFWQNNNPLEDLIDMIEEDKRRNKK